MYDNYYNEYIRSVLGYPNHNEADYYQNYNYLKDNKQSFDDSSRSVNNELEDCYPEIYKIVYPMIQKRCENITKPATKDDINRMVEEIYSNIEGNDQIFLNLNINNNIETRSKQEPRYFNGKRVIEEPKRPVSTEKENHINNESKVENRALGMNNGLSDIIRILLLRELLGRPGCQGGGCRPGPRPPFPPPPGPRPLFY